MEQLELERKRLSLHKQIKDIDGQIEHLIFLEKHKSRAVRAWLFYKYGNLVCFMILWFLVMCVAPFIVPSGVVFLVAITGAFAIVVNINASAERERTYSIEGRLTDATLLKSLKILEERKKTAEQSLLELDQSTIEELEQGGEK